MLLAPARRKDRALDVASQMLRHHLRPLRRALGCALLCIGRAVHCTRQRRAALAASTTGHDRLPEMRKGRRPESVTPRYAQVAQFGRFTSWLVPPGPGPLVPTCERSWLGSTARLRKSLFCQYLETTHVMRMTQAQSCRKVATNTREVLRLCLEILHAILDMRKRCQRSTW